MAQVAPAEGDLRRVIGDGEGQPDGEVAGLTEADLLDGAGIPWGYYAAWNDQRGYVWSAFSAIERVRMNPDVWQRHIFPVDNFVADVEDGRLAPVTWVTPRYEVSEHPEWSFCHGENWTST